MPNLIRRIQKPTNQDIFVYYIVSSLLMFVCTLTHLSPFASQSSEIGTFSLCYKTWCTESMGSIQKRYNHLSKENKYDTRACQPASQTDRQTDRQTASQTVRQSDSQTVRQPDSQTARQPGQTGRQAARQPDMRTGSQTASQTARQPDSQTAN